LSSISLLNQLIKRELQQWQGSNLSLRVEEQISYQAIFKG
jgi:hypothetical protein